MLITDGGVRSGTNNRASSKLAVPATNPLMDAIQVGSANDTLRVRLLSNPQARQAPSTASVGPVAVGSDAATGLVGQVRTVAPARIASMPSATRLSKFSRKTNHASIAVKIASALSSSDAPDPAIRVSPTISSTGAITPPAATAAASQGHSPRAS